MSKKYKSDVVYKKTCKKRKEIICILDRVWERMASKVVADESVSSPQSTIANDRQSISTDPVYSRTTFSCAPAREVYVRKEKLVCFICMLVLAVLLLTSLGLLRAEEVEGLRELVHAFSTTQYLPLREERVNGTT